MPRFFAPLVLLAAVAHSAEAWQFEAHFSGSNVLIGSDTNGDGWPGSISESRFVSRRWGAFTSRAAVEVEAWDGVSFCPTTDGSWAVRVGWVEFSEVWTLANLDQLFLGLSPNDESYLCAYADGTFYAVLNAVVTGGTGLLSGRAGRLTFTTKGRSLDNALGHAAFEGTVKGDIE